MFFGKCRECFYGVITDGIGLDVILIKIGQFVLQLHELDFAIASPVGAAMKKNEGLVCAIGFVGDGFVPLVGQCECGDRFTYLGARWKVVAVGIATVG